jgi:hypothetical protein
MRNIVSTNYDITSAGLNFFKFSWTLADAQELYNKSKRKGREILYKNLQ